MTNKETFTLLVGLGNRNFKISVQETSLGFVVFLWITRASAVILIGSIRGQNHNNRLLYVLGPAAGDGSSIQSWEGQIWTGIGAR